MRRVAAAALAALTLLLTGAATARTPTTSVGTSLREYHVSLYRGSVPRGILRFSVHDFGQDPHDLAVKRDGRILTRSPQLLPGASRVLRVRLTRPGRYVVFCTLPHHAAWGMRATIRVR